LATHAGTIGAVGSGIGGTGTETRQRNETVYFQDDSGNSQTVITNYEVKYRFYRKQISISFWEEVRVYDLTMVYDVAGNNGEHKTTLGDDNGEICLIPLDRSIVRDYPLRVQQELCVRSFNFVFNSYVIQKVKWYERGFFGTLLKVVSIVLIFYGFYTSAFWQSLGTMTAAAALNLIAQQIIVYVAVTVGIRLFVKLVGPELAFIAALAAMMMGMFGEGLATMTPDMLLNAAAMIFDGVNAFVADAFQDLQKEMESFLSTKTEMEKELERAMDLLDTKNHPITPIILGETPGEFIYRTTIFGASGFTQLNNVGDYVERSLYLPTTSSSFGVM